VRLTCMRACPRGILPELANFGNMQTAVLLYLLSLQLLLPASGSNCTATSYNEPSCKRNSMKLAQSSD
jgi:hypothetical protein